MLDHSSMMFPETAHFSGRVVHGFADFLRKHKNDIYPHLTDNDHAYLTDFFDTMLEHNENITLKEITYA